MLFAEIFVSIVLAVLVGTVFFYIFKKVGPWNNFWAFLIVLILAGLIAEFWVAPIGPLVFGVSWLGAFAFILFFAILIAAATPTDKREREVDAEIVKEKMREEGPAIVALGTFFWFLVFIMAVAAIGGMLYAP